MEDQKKVENHPYKDPSSNNLSKILSPYLPKEVLEEIDINDSSKTNSLSKNSSSDNSMGKSTKSQTINNNGKNSDSNNSGSNNNKGNNSDTSGNSKNDINKINLNRKYHSYPKDDLYQIKHKLKKYFFHENKYNKKKESNHSIINIRKINRSFSRKNLNVNKTRHIFSNSNDNIIHNNNIITKSKKEFNNLEESNININKHEKYNFNNSDKNISSKWSHPKENKSKQLKLIYSHPNLNTYKLANNSHGFNLLNTSPNPNIKSQNEFYKKNVINNAHNLNNRNGNINTIYNINNNNVNNNRAFNRIQNGMNVQYQNENLNRYILSNNNNTVNKSKSQYNNIDFRNLYQNRNTNNGFNHFVNYVNNINNELNNSMNENETNYLYKSFPNNDGRSFMNKDFQNLFYNLNPLNQNNLNTINYMNNNYNNLINNIFQPNNSNNKCINMNNININNGKNHNKKHNHNHNTNGNYNHNYNSNYNGNGNGYNNNINNNSKININGNNNKRGINTNHGDFSDSQIDYLFNQLYSLPNEVCILLYIINKKGVRFFINLTKTIKGSKYLQNLLQTCPPKEMEVVCITKIICVNYKEIMCDYYGNYFLQKFFPFCNQHQRLDILISIKNDYINIANDICGNHSLQCLISLQNTNEEKELIKIYIQNNLKDLCLGINSSHLVSKIIKHLKESERQYINIFVMNNILDLCIDPNGICVIKEFIYNMKSDSYIKLVLSIFEKETKKLTLNQYGNYIIQEVIRFFGYNYCKNIINVLIENLVEFSLAKFSSNVIDFMIEYLSKKQFMEFCKILKLIFLEEKNFKEMIKNKYSIYVIENCLELLIQINENYYINSIRNNLGYFNKENNGEKDDEYSFENFLQLKKQIFQFIENNSAAKEKKKILALIKSNRYKRV